MTGVAPVRARDKVAAPPGCQYDLEVSDSSRGFSRAAHPDMPKTRKHGSRSATMAERAYHAIKDGILKGEIEEGTFLSEQMVRRKCEIGRTPYREACNRLHNEHILEVVPRYGYFVPELSFHAVQDMFEARLVIESAIAELATLRARAPQLKNLERMARNIEEYYKTHANHEKIIAANTEFHVELARATQNSVLVDLAQRVLERCERLSYLELRQKGGPAKTDAILHWPIVEAIRNKDSASARKAVLKDITEGQAGINAVSRWVPPKVI